VDVLHFGQLTLEAADHDRGYLGRVDLGGAVEAERVKVFEQPGEALRETIVGRAGEEEAVLEV